MLTLITIHYILAFILALIIIIGSYWILIASVNAVKCMTIAFFNRNKINHEDDLFDDEH